MNPFFLAPLFAGLVNVGVAVLAAALETRTRAKRVLVFCSAAIALWNFGAVGMIAAPSASVALVVTRVLHIGVIFLPALFFDLATAITRSPAARYRIWPYVFFGLFAVADLTPAFLPGVRPIAYGWYGTAGPVYWIYTGTMPIVATAAVVVLLERRFRLQGPERRRLTVLTFGTAMLLVVGCHDLLPVIGYDRYPGTNITIYPWGTLGAGMFGILVAYGILQDQMLDVRVTLSRVVATVVRLLFLLSLAFVFLFAIVLTSHDPNPIHVVVSAMIALTAAALVAAVLFPKLFGASTERLERTILGDTFEYQEQLRVAIDGLAAVRDYHLLLLRIEDMLRDAMQLDAFGLVLLDPQSRQPRTVRLHRCELGQPADWTFDGAVFAFLRQNRRPWIDLRDAGADIQVGRSDASRFDHLFAIHTHAEPFGVIAAGTKVGGGVVSKIDRELLQALAASVGAIVERLHLAEQADIAAKLEHVAMMSRGLAHDLNNLITPISSFLVHVDGKFAPASAQAEVHDHAKRSVRVMQEYVRDAMFFGKRLSPKLQPTSLAEIFTTVRDITATRAAQRSVSVAVELSDVTVLADRLLIQRLITNLVNNAVDACVTGQSVTLSARTADSHWVSIRVTDTGCGIPEENLARVFDPYFTTKQFGDDVRGFGLGLSICRKIVDLHRGRIYLASRVGHGTTATVELPRT